MVAGVRTYSSSSGLPKDEVRERIGDFESGRMVLDDDLITYQLAKHSNSAVNAALVCARVLYAYLVRQPDRSVESLSLTRARLESYREIIKLLEEEAGSLATCTAGGTSIAEDDTLLVDGDWRPHWFSVGWSDRDNGGQG